LEVDYAWLGWPEILYRMPHLSRADEICDPRANARQDNIFSTLCSWFTNLSRTFSSAQFVIPLAVGAHRDHAVTSQAASHCVDHLSLIFYEDFPYVAFQPQAVQPLIRSRDLIPFHLDISSFLKKRILATLQYQSQLDMLCHPPKRIEDIIRSYTAWYGEGEATSIERYWIKSPDQFPLSFRKKETFKGN
jgi:hypothetical protein